MCHMWLYSQHFLWSRKSSLRIPKQTAGIFAGSSQKISRAMHLLVQSPQMAQEVSHICVPFLLFCEIQAESVWITFKIKFPIHFMYIIEIVILITVCEGGCFYIQR